MHDLYNKMKCTYDKLRHITKQNENFYQSTNFVDPIDVIVVVVESTYFLGHQRIVLYAESWLLFFRKGGTS